MVKAVIDGVVVAESDETKMIEGNHYFPPTSIRKEFFSEAELHTVCHWKGTADYFNVKTKDKEHANAAWTYANPTTDRAAEIKDYIAFYPNIADVVAE